MMRISNLKKGVVGVCAATMLAGMCAVPAFAADTATQVYTLDTSAANISVTVPAGDVAASLLANGNLTLPDLDVTNGSLAPVYISKVEVKDVNNSVHLLNSTDYNDSTKGAVSNATKVTMASGGKSIELGNFTAAGGTAIDEADAVTIPGNDKATLASTSAMKNFTGGILGQATLQFLTVSFTVSGTTV
jgi:hypothetical protein